MVSLQPQSRSQWDEECLGGWDRGYRGGSLWKPRHGLRCLTSPIVQIHVLPERRQERDPHRICQVSVHVVWSPVIMSSPPPSLFCQSSLPSPIPFQLVYLLIGMYLYVFLIRFSWQIFHLPFLFFDHTCNYP